MATIAENLEVLANNKADIKEAIEYKVDDTITENMCQWADIIRSIDPDTNTYGPHCDENGIWHKPAEWPDIESLPIPENSSIVYLLYDNRLTHNAYASFTANRSSGSITIDKGHIEDGEYVVDQQLYSGAANKNILESLYESAEDYTIYRIQGLYLVSVITSSYGSTANSPYYPSTTLPCIMRYGSLPWGNSCKFLCAYLESDNILNFMANRTSYSTSLADMYFGNYNMQRWRSTGWNIKNNSITSFNRFFSNCFLLSDINSDFKGWVKNTTIVINQMFMYCVHIKQLDITDWDTSGLTGSAALVFYYCWGLEKIKGIEDLDLSKCTTINSIFYYCRNLTGDFDLENWAISDKCTNIGGFCQGCDHIKTVSIKGWDLSKVTACASVFSGCQNLESVDMTDITPITNVCTDADTIFSNCVKIKSIAFDGWDFSGVTVNSNLYQQIMYCYSLQKLEYKNCTFPSSLSSQGAAYYLVGTNLYSLLYFDIRDLDASVYTNTQVASMLTGHAKLEELYPPQHINKQLNISTDYMLTHDSLLRILNNLDTVTGTVKLILGAYHNANLTAEEKAIATNKGWTVTVS